MGKGEKIMKVYLNNISGLADAVVSMFMSKRSWTREKENQIRTEMQRYQLGIATDEEKERCEKNLKILFKWGQKHMTMLRYIDLSVTVEGLHRGGQDDLDSHARRMENRIIRSSTRLADFKDGEMSSYYKDKIASTDEALGILGIELPNYIVKNGQIFLKTVNGYIREDLYNNRDVKRGLYMLSIPSNCIFKINLTEFAHILKERDKNSHAHPELQECIESILVEVQKLLPWVTREYLYGIPN